MGSSRRILVVGVSCINGCLVSGERCDNGEPWEDDAGLTVVGHEVVVQELLEEGGDYGDTGDAGKHGEEGGDTGEHGEERNT